MLTLSGARAAGGEAEEKAELRRTAREWLFFDANVGARYRKLYYAEGAAPGSDDRSELRVHVTGRAGSPGAGPLGAYAALGLVGRLKPSIAEDTGDPLADPYDTFEAAQNLRLLGAYAEYASRDERGRARFSVRAGRLSDLDRRASFLLFDGAQAVLQITDAFGLRAYGGRRAILDGDFTDQRSDVPVQLVAGGALEGKLGGVRVEAGYRFEEAHRGSLSADWMLADGLGVGAHAELIAGRGSVSGIVGFDGDGRTSDGRFGADWDVEAQIGEDPRPFGRAGLTARPEDISAAMEVPVTEGRIDRLFFGPERSALRARFGAEWFLLETLSLQGGVFARVPFEEEGRSDLRPQVLEVWIGPELSLEGGTEIGAEARAALQDPGSSTLVFAGRGDGERSRGAVRAWAEHGFSFGQDGDWRLSLRAEGEAALYGYSGVYAETANQKSVTADVLAALAMGDLWRVAVRWGIESLPAYLADGVSLGQGVEVWVGGTL